MRDVISRHSSRLDLCVRLLDAMALLIAGALAGRLYFGHALIDAAPIHTMLLYLCAGLAFLLFRRVDLYQSRRGKSMADMLLRLAGAWSMALFIGVLFSFLIHQTGALSRLWLCYWFLLGLAMLMCFRALAYSVLNYLRKKGLNSKRVLIVGYGPIGREMHRRALQQNWCGYEVKAVQAEDPDPILDEAGVARVATPAAIASYVAAHAIDEIWITLPLSASARLCEVQLLLRNSLVDIRWVPDTLSMHILSNRMVDFLGFPAVELNRPRSRDVNGLIKDGFDRVFALAVLLALAPVFAVLAAAIKRASPGPVLFRQPRLGLDGKTFMVYKFRSMHVHHEPARVTQAKRDDPRAFALGRWMRRTSIDELPQFLNVLIGDMSVVGPRPHALQHNEQYKDLLESYMLRHRVKPGITGWAQIHGYRGETDTVDKMANRVKFDLHYIQHWSLWLDLHIIVWTALKGWTGKNAY